MKKYFVILVCVLILFLVSVIYKQHNAMVFNHFPIPEKMVKSNLNASDAPFYLFLFFSDKDCAPCLEKMVGVLNTLPAENFCVSGIVPGQEIVEQTNRRRFAGARFPLYSNSDYKKYVPFHSPTLVGVSPSGRIVLVLPGINGQMDKLEDHLNTLYAKLYPTLKEEYLLAFGNKR